MSIEKITDAEVRARWVQRLADAPNRGGRYGTPGLSAAEIKAAMDALPLHLVERYNALVEALGDGSLAAALAVGREGESLAALLAGLEDGTLAAALSVDGVRSLTALAAAFDTHRHAEYAPLGHAHTADYAALSHRHDGYAAAEHTHAGVYAEQAHTHEGVYAPLENGKVPAAALPSYVDDVVELARIFTSAEEERDEWTEGHASVYSVRDDRLYFGEEWSIPPSTWVTPDSVRIEMPQSGKIYVETSSGKTYRYSGHAMVEIASGDYAERGHTHPDYASNEHTHDVYDRELWYLGEQISRLNYEVGELYLTTSELSPAERFGGTWEKIQGKFLFGATDAVAAGTEGGAQSVTLTRENLPIHTHQLYNSSQVGSAVYNTYGRYAVMSDEIVQAYREPYTMSDIGLTYNDPIRILPPYFAVYIWRRIR